MRDFAEIHQIAVERKGGEATLEGMLFQPLSAGRLSQTEDHRWLATMAKCLFQAGFNWKVIDAKWDGFEEAFDRFDPARVAFYDHDAMDRLLSDKRIVRNGAKIKAVVENAGFLMELAKAHGSAARFFSEWPDEDYVGLLAYLGKRGSRLGGVTGQRVLREMGKDSFILSNDVTARLIAEGIVDKPPTSKRDLAAVQAAFNSWREESGRSLTEISRVLAMSVGT